MKGTSVASPPRTWGGPFDLVGGSGQMTATNLVSHRGQVSPHEPTRYQPGNGLSDLDTR